ncbi:hypothetical protein D3C72_1572140 [compost metagenome]
MGTVQLCNDLVEHVDGNHGAGTVGVELLALAFQVLEQVCLQVSARSHVHDLEQRGDGEMVVYIGAALQKYIQPAQQILQPEVRAYAFVKWVLVNNHRKTSVLERKGCYQFIV